MQVFLLEIRNIRRSVITWAISLSAVAAFLIAFFPSLQTDAMQALAAAKLEGIDKTLLAVLGLQELPDFTKITNFFGYAIQFITLAFAVFAANKGVSALIREETEGTIEYLSAKPVSRLDIYFQKLLAITLGFLAVIMAMFITSLIGYLAVTDYTLIEAKTELLIIYGGAMYSCALFMALGFFLSTILKSSHSAAGVVIGLVFGTFVIGVTSILIPDLDFLVYFSPLDWIKTAKLMESGLALPEILIGTLGIIFSIAGGAYIYNKKDFRLG